jgi:hypothetical protein
MGRKVPGEKLKSRAGIEVGLKIARRHRQFVEIGQKAGSLKHGI